MVELACRGADVSEKIREIIVLLDSEISCGNDIEADYYLSLLLQNVPRLRDAGVEFLGPKFFGSNAVAAVRAILPHIARFYDVEFRRLETAIDLLVLLGPEAVREVPEVMQRMLWKILPLSLCEGQKIPEWSMSKDSFYELLGFFGPAAIVVVPMLIEKLQQPYARAAARALVAIGDVAIPQLQSLITSTFWSRSRDPDLENKSKRIISAIKGHRLADPFWDL